MKLHAIRYCPPESIRAAVRLLAMAMLRDGRVDWREIDHLERMNAFQALGIERSAFLQVVEDLPVEHVGHGALRLPVFESELQLVTCRPLQLLISGFLVRIAEADGEIAPEESALVRKAFHCWNVSPEALHRAMRIPEYRSLAALGMLPEAA